MYRSSFITDERLSIDAMKSLIGKNYQRMEANLDYDEFVLVGAEKPPRAAFEAKLRELIDGKLLKEFRHLRNKKISLTDFLMVADFPYPSEEIKQAWITYRQALRDITATTTPYYDENNNLIVTWPTPPIWPANVV